MRGVASELYSLVPQPASPPIRFCSFKTKLSAGCQASPAHTYECWHPRNRGVLCRTPGSRSKTPCRRDTSAVHSTGQRSILIPCPSVARATLWPPIDAVAGSRKPVRGTCRRAEGLWGREKEEGSQHATGMVMAGNYLSVARAILRSDDYHRHHTKAGLSGFD